MVEKNLELKSLYNLFESISLFHKNFSNVKEKRRKEIMWRERKGKEEQRLCKLNCLNLNRFD